MTECPPAHRVRATLSSLGHRLWPLALGLMLLYGHSNSSRAEEMTFRFDIPASPAHRGLNLFAEQADIQVIYPYDQVKAFWVNPVQGEYTRADAQIGRAAWRERGEHWAA